MNKAKLICIGNESKQTASLALQTRDHYLNCLALVVFRKMLTVMYINEHNKSDKQKLLLIQGYIQIWTFWLHVPSHGYLCFQLDNLSLLYNLVYFSLPVLASCCKWGVVDKTKCFVNLTWHSLTTNSRFKRVKVQWSGI